MLSSEQTEFGSNLPLDHHGYSKGGTSLSKGHGLIHRFSEDIDILIHPDIDDLPIGKNQNKTVHIEARRSFHDGLSTKITIPGMSEVERDEAFDDQRMRSAGTRLHYTPRNPLPEGVKDGILLEAIRFGGGNLPFGEPASNSSRAAAAVICTQG